MGLGKTVETIAYVLALLEEHDRVFDYGAIPESGSLPQVEAALLSLLDTKYQCTRLSRPSFLIVAPLSVVDAWQEHVARLCDDERVSFLKLQGSKAERAEALDMMRQFRSMRYSGWVEEAEDIYARLLARHAALKPADAPNTHAFPATLPPAVLDALDATVRARPGVDVLLTTYEALATEQPALQKLAFTALILDEAHRVKNPATRLFALVTRELTWRSILLLTGTPCQNTLQELWSLLAVLALPDADGIRYYRRLPHVYDRNYTFYAPFEDGPDGDPLFLSLQAQASSTTSLRQLLPSPPVPAYTPLTAFKPDSSPAFSTAFASLQRATDASAVSASASASAASLAAPHLHRLLSVYMLRRTKADAALALPPKRTLVVYTGLSALQTRLYRAIVGQHAPSLLKCVAGDGDPASGASVASGLGSMKRVQLAATMRCLSNVMLSLRKVVNHPYLIPGVEQPPFEEGSHLYEASAKLGFLQLLLRRLHRDGHRVLLFSTFTQTLDIIQVSTLVFISTHSHSQSHSCLLHSSPFLPLRTSPLSRTTRSSASTAASAATIAPPWSPSSSDAGRSRRARAPTVDPVTVTTTTTTRSCSCCRRARAASC
jgi:SNF2 family DNA or RNA helicase